tara:strand:- start:13 stop:414 length:402 start_codon:yes stop_codon:yes gene_type:complete
MKELIKEIKRFIIVGLVSNALNFLVYVFLYKIGTTIWIASAFGYIVGLSNSFYFGKTWVFNPERVVYKHAIIKFVFIYGFGGLGMVLIITMLDSLTVIDYRIIWFFGALFAFLNNYLGSKIFVFPKENNENGK